VIPREHWGSEELRRAALVALGKHADQRTVDVLRSAFVTVTPGAAHWESSAGPVHAHRVTLGLDARRLGRLRAAPATVDALCAAVAAAIAQRPGETLLELSLRWAPGAGVVAAGYRDAPAPPVSMRQALVDYLDAAGSESVARAVETASVTPEYPSHDGADHRVILRLDRAAASSLTADARAILALTSAVRDLLGDVRALLEVT
jgi:hypothetical protein